MYVSARPNNIFGSTTVCPWNVVSPRWCCVQLSIKVCTWNVAGTRVIYKLTSVRVVYINSMKYVYNYCGPVFWKIYISGRLFALSYRASLGFASLHEPGMKITMSHYDKHDFLMTYVMFRCSDKLWHLSTLVKAIYCINFSLSHFYCIQFLSH